MNSQINAWRYENIGLSVHSIVSSGRPLTSQDIVKDQNNGSACLSLTVSIVDHYAIIPPFPRRSCAEADFRLGPCSREELQLAIYLSGELGETSEL